MFFHMKELQYEAKPSKPDPLFAKQLQEIGQFRYVSPGPAYGPKPPLKPSPPYIHNTPPTTRESQDEDP